MQSGNYAFDLQIIIKEISENQFTGFIFLAIFFLTDG
jgi:hypothetical protein